MKLNEIRAKSGKELVKMVSELREEIFRLKWRLKTGELNQNTNIRKTKKDVARILTILNSGEKDETKRK